MSAFAQHDCKRDLTVRVSTITEVETSVFKTVAVESTDVVVVGIVTVLCAVLVVVVTAATVVVGVVT